METVEAKVGNFRGKPADVVIFDWGLMVDSSVVETLLCTVAKGVWRSSYISRTLGIYSANLLIIGIHD